MIWRRSRNSIKTLVSHYWWLWSGGLNSEFSDSLDPFVIARSLPENFRVPLGWWVQLVWRIFPDWMIGSALRWFLLQILIREHKKKKLIACDPKLRSVQCVYSRLMQSGSVLIRGCSWSLQAEYSYQIQKVIAQPATWVEHFEGMCVPGECKMACGERVVTHNSRLLQ